MPGELGGDSAWGWRGEKTSKQDTYYANLKYKHNQNNTLFT